MTDSSTTSRDRPDFAPSWLLRNSNHSPTPPPFRTVPTASPREDWDRPGGGSDRKVQNGSRFQFHERLNGDLQSSENYFNYSSNGHGRISEYEHDGFLRRSNSINASVRNNHLPSRNNGASGHQNNWNGRSKFDGHFRNGNGAGNIFQGPFRESHVNSNGISYSIVTSKGLKPGAGPTSPVLQQSDFPSLNVNPVKVEPAKCAQNTVWGNPPHLAKTMKRSLSSQSYMEGGTILGPHYGKGFYVGTRSRDLKDEFDPLNSGCGDGPGADDYGKSDFAEHSSTGSAEDDVHADNLIEESHQDQDSRSDHEDGWTLSEVPRREKLTEPSMLSSTGSTGSVESIDSHHSNLSGGAAMMVEDLLDDFISEEEKLRIFHALEEIKERTGSESYYERVALTESRHRGQRRYPFLSDSKGEEEDEDPDDRFLK